MIYQLRINIYADHAGDFDDVMDKLDDLKPDMRVVNPGQPDQECSVIEVLECHHDDHPHLPCTEVSWWDNCPSILP